MHLHTWRLFLRSSFLSLSLYLSLCVSLSLYLSWVLLTHCQDHILTENIWFVWSRTSYSGDKWRCYRCGTDEQTTNDERRTREDRATQPNGCWMAEFRKYIWISGTLRSWGHLSFNYYLVKTDPMLHIFGSKIISLTFIDILNANLSEIETL